MGPVVEVGRPVVGSVRCISIESDVVALAKPATTRGHTDSEMHCSTLHIQIVKCTVALYIQSCIIHVL